MNDLLDLLILSVHSILLQRLLDFFGCYVASFVFVELVKNFAEFFDVLVSQTHHNYIHRFTPQPNASSVVPQCFKNFFRNLVVCFLCY